MSPPARSAASVTSENVLFAPASHASPSKSKSQSEYPPCITIPRGWKRGAGERDDRILFFQHGERDRGVDRPALQVHTPGFRHEGPGEDTASDFSPQPERHPSGENPLTFCRILHTLSGNPGGPLLQKLKIQIDNHLTLREKIVETIRNAIVNGQLAAGTRVAEPDLADKFGISRTRTRER